MLQWQKEVKIMMVILLEGEQCHFDFLFNLMKGFDFFFSEAKKLGQIIGFPLIITWPKDEFYI